MPSPRRAVPLVVLLALAALVAGCSRTVEAGPQVGASTFDPLTVRIPPSPLDPETPPEPGALRITGTPSLGLGLLRVAGAEGLLAEQGLGVRFLEAPDESAVGRQLARGTADAAVVSSEQALMLDEADVPIRIILLLTSSKTDDLLVARSDLGGIDGLVGRRVAYPPGGDGELVLRGALAAAGLGFDDVEAVVQDDAAPGAALAAGEVDAEVLLGAEAQRRLEADEALEVAWAAGEQPGLVSRVVVVREDVAQQRPGQLLALVRSWQDVYLLDREEPERIGELVGTIQGLDGPEALAAVEATALYDVPQNAVELFPGGEYHDAVIGLVAELSAEAGWIAPPVDPRALLDGVFAQTVATAG